MTPEGDDVDLSALSWREVDAILGRPPRPWWRRLGAIIGGGIWRRSEQMTIRPVRPALPTFPQSPTPRLTAEIQSLYQQLTSAELQRLVEVYADERPDDPAAQERAAFIQHLLRQREGTEP